MSRGLWILLAASVLVPPSATSAATPYTLDPESGYLEGCFDPCLCPVMFNLTLGGSFLAEAQSSGDGHLLVTLTDISWTFQMNEETVNVHGSGLLDLWTDRQRLELDLTLDGGPVRHFDSGEIAQTVSWPAIDAAAAENGFFCYDYGFQVKASPGAVAQDPVTWSGLKARYR